MSRPHVLLSVATSIDGCIDDASDTRLLLSNEEDFDRVDGVRAASDAILVGANTVRRDDPRLLVRSAARREQRVRDGRPPNPTKVLILGAGDVDPAARFFTTGESSKLVYTTPPRADAVGQQLAGLAEIVPVGDPVDLAALLDDLGARGVTRLLVEGGGAVHTAFLRAGLVDELHLAIAPFLVGDPAAPRFVHPGRFPYGPDRPFTLVETTQLGNVVLLRYLA